MRRTRLASSATVLAATLAATVIADPVQRAEAKDPPGTATSYPKGRSLQKFGDHAFDLVVPDGAAPERKWSLVLGVGMAPDSVGDTAALAKDGFVLCCPQPLRGPMWATSEASELLDLVEHLATVLPVAADRVHVMQSGADHGFATFVAFDKRSDAPSLCLVDTSVYRGKGPPPAAKKRVAVLSLWGSAEPRNGYDGSTILEALDGKVRTLEWRRGTTFDPYFRYWLHVADGRFVPGWDLSFDWIEDAPPAPPNPKAKSGEEPKAAPPKALDRARADAAAGNKGALVYFWSAADAEKPDARALQNDVFFRPEIRDLGARVVTAKVEKEKAEEAFRGFGLTATPAVVVLDPAFNVREAFDGKADAKALAEALRAVAPPAKPGR